MDQPPADRQPAGAAAREQYAGSLLGPGQETGVAGRQAVEEQPEEDDESDVGGELDRDRDRKEAQVDVADFLPHPRQSRHREQQCDRQSNQ